MIGYVKIYRKYNNGINKRIIKMLFKRKKLINVHIVDKLKGPITSKVEEDTKWISFGDHTSVGVDIYQDLTDEKLWIHEFTEHILSYVLLDILVDDCFKRSDISRFISTIEITATNGKKYSCRVKHMLAALCTDSQIDDIEVNADEYAEFFGFINKRNISYKCRCKQMNRFNWNKHEEICDYYTEKLLKKHKGTK